MGVGLGMKGQRPAYLSVHWHRFYVRTCFYTTYYFLHLFPMNQLAAKFYSDTVLSEACSYYDFDFKVAKLIRANQNLVFDCGDKILRLTLSKVRPAEEIEPELAWLLDLHRRGIAVAEVLPSVNNKLMERVGDGPYFSVVCFRKVAGRIPAKEEWNEAFFEQLGDLAGKLLVAGRQFMATTPHEYLAWDKVPEHYCEDHLRGEHFDYRELYRKVTAKLQARPVGPEGLCLIHYDIHYGNFLVEDVSDKIVLFDFEMCCLARPIDEVATALYYARLHPHSEWTDNFEAVFYAAFKRGYVRHHPITPADEAGIPAYLLYRDLMVLGFVNKAWTESELTNKESAYLKRLHLSIERRREIF